LKGTKTFAYGANKEEIKQQKDTWHLYQFPADQTSEFKLTYSAP
jgi:hypothetical protein